MDVYCCKLCGKMECNHSRWDRMAVYDLLYPTVYVLNQLGYECKGVKYTYRYQEEFDFQMELGGFENVNLESDFYEFKSYRYRGETRINKKTLYLKESMKNEYKKMDTRYLKNMFHFNFYYDLYCFASSLPVLNDNTGIKKQSFSKEYFLKLIEKKINRKVSVYLHPDSFFVYQLFKKKYLRTSEYTNIMYYDNCVHCYSSNALINIPEILNRLDIKAMDNGSGYALGSYWKNDILMNTFDEVLFGDKYKDEFSNYYKTYIKVSLTEVFKRYYMYLKDTYNIGNCYFSDGDIIYVFIEKGTFYYKIYDKSLIVHNGNDADEDDIIVHGDYEMFVLSCHGLIFKEKFYFD